MSDANIKIRIKNSESIDLYQLSLALHLAVESNVDDVSLVELTSDSSEVLTSADYQFCVLSY